MPIPQINHKPEYNWQKKRKKHAFAKYAWLKNPQFLRFIGYSSLFLLIIGTIFIFWLSAGLPDPNKLMSREVAQSTKIYDRTGETILYEIHGDQKRTMVSLAEIPENVRNATIAIEDKDFYNHHGFSVWAIFRTVVMNVVKGQKAGGSTLTQQFVKNAILTSEKSYVRKLKELILAYRIENKFSKDEILQMYLNEIPYGSTAYGVEAASLRYFGKSVKETNLAEAAILAALPQAPSRYSPYGQNRELLINRQGYILDQMVKQGYASEKEAEDAKAYKLEFKKQAENITAPHFIMYLKDYLAEKYDQKTIEQGGLKIYSTIDLTKQTAAEEIVKDKAVNNAKNYNATNAALVSIDPKTGQILAMVGSKDYFSTDIDGQVNITTSPRQPGSSFKPMVYATSFIKGFTPDTILYDVVTNFSTDPAKKYEPHNYNNQEQGPVTIRKALAGSLNIPAVKAMYLAGTDNVLDLAKQLGYTTLNDKDRFGLSLVLGGGEVKMLEHVNAYSAFARDGKLNTISPILKIEDKDGKVLEEYQKNETTALGTQVARQITDILSDNNARSYVFGAKNFLTLGDRPVAAKTGTTNDYKDAWTIGYTPSIITGVWVGNNDATSMKRGADGSVVAAPIWNAYMHRILDGTPVESFKKPELVKTDKPVLNGSATSSEPIKIDRASGLLATELTPLSFVENKTFGQPHSILYYVDKNNPQGPAPKNPSADSQFNLWEEGIKTWAIKNNLYSTSTAPTEKDNLHIPENKPTIIIEEPLNNQTINDPILSVRVTTSAPRGVSRVEYLLDGKLLSIVTAAPFNLGKSIGYIGNGKHTLLAKSCDDIDNCSESVIDLEFNFTQQILPEISLNISEPANNSIIKSADFPIALKTAVSNMEIITEINYTLKKKGEAIQKINDTKLIGEPGNIWWLKSPGPGTYQLFSEAKDWNGKLYSSAPITITIK